jgi:hypothetical protein
MHDVLEDMRIDLEMRAWLRLNAVIGDSGYPRIH